MVQWDTNTETGRNSHINSSKTYWFGSKYCSHYTIGSTISTRPITYANH